MLFGDYSLEKIIMFLWCVFFDFSFNIFCWLEIIKLIVFTNSIQLYWKAKKNWHQMFPRIFYGISQFDRDLVPSCVFRVTVNSLTFTIIQRIISALGCSLQLQVMLVKYFKISHFYKWCHCLHSNAHLTSK